jgi:hypothetical protein
MPILAVNGRRPFGWWTFDAANFGLRYPGRDREHSVLYVEGLLDEVEARELLAYWREEFDKANAPDFTYTWQGRVFRGAVARRQHYQWADIPLEEVVSWAKERRRSANRIRSLEAETCAPRPVA